MLVVFLPIFVGVTKIIFRNDFVALLTVAVGDEDKMGDIENVAEKRGNTKEVEGQGSAYEVQCLIL